MDSSHHSYSTNTTALTSQLDELEKYLFNLGQEVSSILMHCCIHSWYHVILIDGQKYTWSFFLLFCLFVYARPPTFKLWSRMVLPVYLYSAVSIVVHYLNFSLCH